MYGVAGHTGWDLASEPTADTTAVKADPVIARLTGVARRTAGEAVGAHPRDQLPPEP
jgi:hypothetical protein